MEKQRVTVEMIYQKDFKEKSRGYDPQEVDAFLDDIMEEMECLNKTIDDLQAQLREARQTRPAAASADEVARLNKTIDSLQAQLREARQAQPAAAPSNGSIQEVLAMAVKLKNDTMQEAQTKADAIIAEAEVKAKERLGSLDDEHERLTCQVALLKEAAADYRQKFESLLQAQQEALDNASDLF